MPSIGSRGPSFPNGPQRIAASVLAALLLPSAALAEGTAQIGPNQDLCETERNYIDGQEVPTDATDPRMYPVTIFVDILAVGETINLSAGDNNLGQTVYVDVWAPGVDYDNAASPKTTYTITNGGQGWMAPNAPAPSSIANPHRHVATTTGTYTVRMRTGPEAAGYVPVFTGICPNCVDPFDITVTPPGYVGAVDPYDPPTGGGRVWSQNWNLWANAFTNCADVELYVLADGGFHDTNYVWLFDDEALCGYYYNLVANSLGVIPQSGYSVDVGENPPSTVDKQYPIYLNLPQVAKPTGTEPLILENYGFYDDTLVDQTFSPAGGDGVADTGFFVFDTNLETFGTYAIIIDINDNGVFDPYQEADVLLQDFAKPGHNEIAWDGYDKFGVLVPTGAYDTTIYLRVGDFHFTAYDVEFNTPGLRILGVNEPDGITPPSGATIPTPTPMYWNDIRVDAPLADNPLEISSLAAPVWSGEYSDPIQWGINAHAWGVGATNPGDANNTHGNEALMDTQVFGNAVSIVDRATFIIDPSNSTDLDGDGEPNRTDPDPLDTDADGDGLDDYREIHGADGVDLTGDETLPLDVDSDDDGISDSDEWYVTFTHPSVADTDADGLQDGLELGYDKPLPGGESDAVEEPFQGTSARFEGDYDSGATTTDALDADSDDDGLLDGEEDWNRSGTVEPGEPDPNAVDSDGDGLTDGLELGTDCSHPDTDPTGPCVADADPRTNTDPRRPDTDGDGLTDPAEDADGDGATVNDLGGTGTTGTGETDPADADTDGDGIADGTELSAGWNPLDTDTDDGGVADGEEDADHDGIVDPFESDPAVFDDDDTDGDGLVDVDEEAAGLSPYDADCDDDGLLDGEEVLFWLSDPLGTDTDGDGLPDGMEGGTDCGHPDTKATCEDDLDPLSITSPTDTDSDDDGLPDALEDVNGNGRMDAGETDASEFDSDLDLASDGMELGTDCSWPDTQPLVCEVDLDPTTRTDPRDADTDGDGLLDGAEALDGRVDNAIGGTGTAGSGDTDPLNPDTDGDGLTDGQEVLGTGPLEPWGATKPLDTDTDDGGIPDGVEVFVDDTNPTEPADDVPDADGDFVKDADEIADGTDPNDADTDDDGLLDGEERDASTDARSSDTDGDGLSDGLETGTACAHPQTDHALCTPDADWATQTDPTDADSDDDGLADGVEDFTRDGAMQPGETDPTDADTDGDGLSDGLESGTDCTLPDSDPAFCVIDTDPATTTLPYLPDTDGDGLSDGEEDGNADGAVQPDETDPTDPDTDGDTLSDGDEANGTGPLAPWGATNPLEADTDGGGVEDGLEASIYDTDPNDGADDWIDTDEDGLTDAQETLGLGPLLPFGPTDPLEADTDGDGVQDGTEVGLTAAQGADTGAGFVPDADPTTTTDPTDADTDDDGLLDGDEDGDGGIGPGDTDPNDPDTDDDGLRDGTERGTDCANPDSGPACVPDADPWTTTEPIFADTDDDGLKDGTEDRDRDGAVDAGETDPDDDDTDDDLLLDGDEVKGRGPLSPWGPTDPLDDDTDGGGIDDGTEVLVDGTDPRDPGDDWIDTDGDGLIDLVETMGLGPLAPYGPTDPGQWDTDGDGLADGTEVGVDCAIAAPSCVPDANPRSSTDPNDADTDDDGLVDGEEDADHDGAVGEAETDPEEADTDGDGLSDGLELGTDCADPDSGSSCVADADAGVTVTDPLDDDTDGDGLDDGFEDANRDGMAQYTLGGTGTAGTGETDAAAWDTDADGLGDYAERIRSISPLDTDSDDGSLPDGAEVLVYGTNPRDPSDDILDTDGDGLDDEEEAALGTSATDRDSDDDGLLDGEEVDAGTNPLAEDTDGDGLLDGLESGSTCADAHSDPANCVADADPATTTDPLARDTDADGLDDDVEDADGDGAVGAGETDPADTDSDDDWLPDGVETATDPLDPDDDDDGLLDGEEDRDRDGTVDPGETDPTNPDSDGDGIYDGAEQGYGDPLSLDADSDGLPDALEDADGDGVLDAGETHPGDADTDDDGLLDGEEDADSDGIVDATETDPLSPDTDGDGLWDGTEAGVGWSDRHPDTHPGRFHPDLDGGDTTTDPLSEDTDGDGLLDGAEDANGNGVQTAHIGGTGTTGSGETDPNDPDSDGDGLTDSQEVVTDPLDADTDDGGLLDGLEDIDGDGVVDTGETDPNDPNDDWSVDSDGDSFPDIVEILAGSDPFSQDSDGDGLSDYEEGLDDHDGDGIVDAMDLDSDDDGLSDAAEAVGNTEPDDDDTDDDGLLDSTEDANGNGAVDAGETDPALADTDGDGLADGIEQGLVNPEGDDTDPLLFVPDSARWSVTDPLDDDTDDDGLMDGTEDADGDGAVDADETDPNAADTDLDGILDGTERGLTAPEGDDTDPAVFVPDADPSTTTDPTDRDTDSDGVPDGYEDIDENGAIGEGETDPNDPADPERPPTTVRSPVLEAECGCASHAPTSALVPLLIALLAVPRRRRP